MMTGLLVWAGVTAALDAVATALPPGRVKCVLYALSSLGPGAVFSFARNANEAITGLKR
jgi:hypothetical protein